MVSEKNIEKFEKIYNLLQNKKMHYDDIKKYLNNKKGDILTLHQLNKLTRVDNNELKVFCKTDEKSVNDRYYFLPDNMKNMPYEVIRDAIIQGLDWNKKTRNYKRNIPNTKKKSLVVNLY